VSRPCADASRPASTSTFVRCGVSRWAALAAATTQRGSCTNLLHSSGEKSALFVNSSSPSTRWDQASVTEPAPEARTPASLGGVADDPQTAWQDDDFRLIMNGPVTLYWRPEILTATTDRLAGHGYHLVSLDASGWATPAQFHHDVAAALDFPDYYGRNLDALNDCLGDVVDRAYGWPADAAGLALVFWHYDHLAASAPDLAQAVLDIIANQSRAALVFGRRLLCLVHSDDATIRFQPVGARPVNWNDAEWSDQKRGLRA